MRLLRYVASSILLMVSYTAHSADDSGDSGTETLTEYLKNLGAYLGFDLTQELQSPIATLLDVSASTLAQQYSFVTLLGAIPVNAYNDALAYFVPSNTNNYSLINDMANYTFQTQSGSGAYNTPGTGEGGGISVSALIDQPTYQNDPVSQSVLNILTTPQVTYCMNNDVNAWTDDCKYLYNTKIMTNVIGALPTPDNFFTYDYNESVMTQLNGNTLLAPLLYSTESTSSTTSSGGEDKNDDEGLTAQNQAQEAENFIRYVTRSVTPPDLPKRMEYSNLYSQATYSGSDADSLFKKQLAQERISKYLAKLRVYSAQRSVPTSNLYSILSKRMPQKQSSDNSTQTSQALSEFQMATRRLYDPSKKDSENTKQWIDQINEASNATVQKEIAILLSEINYQLYLSRQQEERTLATLSVMLMQSIMDPSFGSDADIDYATNSDSDS
ncbi:MAG: type IVB secretion system protein IcmX [Legionellaceae bacterium]|nr:type IVB secretion system protein IcmX [Legionellaceae bacterium]